MDWPLSVAEKQSRAFDLYQREVVAVEASLQAAERELRKLKDDQGRSQSFKARWWWGPFPWGKTQVGKQVRSGSVRFGA
eukprot:s242_g3.t1